MAWLLYRITKDVLTYPQPGTPGRHEMNRGCALLCYVAMKCDSVSNGFIIIHGKHVNCVLIIHTSFGLWIFSSTFQEASRSVVACLLLRSVVYLEACRKEVMLCRYLALYMDSLAFEFVSKHSSERFSFWFVKLM